MRNHDANIEFIKEVLINLGLPVLKDENFKDTPWRWVKYLESYCQEYRPGDDLGTTFPLVGQDGDKYDRAMIVQVGIPYRAACAHHLLPVLGVAHVGYLPQDRVVGLSKLSRLVYGLSHRQPSLQEDICNSITNMLMYHLKPRGAMCVITAEHGCMAARGIEEATGCIKTVTASVKGLFQDQHESRQEFYKLVELGAS